MDRGGIGQDSVEVEQDRPNRFQSRGFMALLDQKALAGIPAFNRRCRARRSPLGFTPCLSLCVSVRACAFS